MKLKLCAVYDQAIEAYKPPMAYLSTGEALRNWIDAVNNDELSLKKSPGDYTFFEIGEYDQRTGIITQYEAHKRISTGNEALIKRENH